MLMNDRHTRAVGAAEPPPLRAGGAQACGGQG
jgi:hypothetical protein